jgi:hypothetical protein|nr:MAG TPA: hypothetical protein [Caudoviricetes sp.]
MANKAISTLAVGSSVYLNVGGVRKEFLVVHQGKPSSLYDSSCNGTWLLMKDIYEDRQWHSSNVNNLENSNIHSYLNGMFLNLFESNIRDAIKRVKIPYRKNGGGGGADQSGVNGLPAKIFLLSGYEVGWTTSDNQNFPQDGAKLSYFEAGTVTSANNKRVANLDGSAFFWWLRSPCYSSNVWRVSPNGLYDNSNAFNSAGIRPALVLPPDMEVDSSGNVTPPPPATHKALVNGTAYEVKGGKCLVNGTVYNILKGRTLIGGTGYDINFEPDVSLTWYFNQKLSIPVSATSTTFSTRAHYEGDSKTITGIQIINREDNPNMSYLGSGFAFTAWDQRRGWRDAAYRAITFDEAPSGDLLAWLQENATPQ